VYGEVGVSRRGGVVGGYDCLQTNKQTKGEEATYRMLLV